MLLATAEGDWRMFLQLAFAVGDLVGMQPELLGQFGKRSVFAKGRQGDLDTGVRVRRVRRADFLTIGNLSPSHLRPGIRFGVSTYGANQN